MINDMLKEDMSNLRLPDGAQGDLRRLTIGGRAHTEAMVHGTRSHGARREQAQGHGE